jgi:pimeloyl-ACP methyl ester carboxylesterase
MDQMDQIKILGCELFQQHPDKAGILSIETHSIQWEIHGNGPVKVVLVMGFMASMAGWTVVLEHFLSTTKYSFLLLDNRGSGHSNPGSFGQYSTKGMALDVLAVMEEAGWDTNCERSCHLVGISMGGMISLSLTLLKPKLFKSLSLLVTCAKRQTPPGHKFTSEFAIATTLFDQKARIIALMGIMFSDEVWLREKDLRFPQFVCNRDRIFSVLWNRSQKAPRAGIKAMLGQAAAIRYHFISPDELKSIGENIPNIVAIAGKQDKMIDYRCTEHLGKHLGEHCKTVVFETKGHVILLEAEFETIKLLKENWTKGEEMYK